MREGEDVGVLGEEKRERERESNVPTMKEKNRKTRWKEREKECTRAQREKKGAR